MLTRINLDDLVASFGWQERPLLAAAARLVFRGPARKFARQMVGFDAAVRRRGLPEAARRLLAGYVREVRLFGREHLPRTGPLLVLSNHPGMSDTVCLFAAIDRADLRIIALDRPFLQALPDTTRHLFFIGDEPAERLGAVRKATAHLRTGGALLTFPAGKIEPDPDVYPGAEVALAGWSDSTGVFLRFAPETRLLPALVRGVLWERAVRHPLTRLRPAGEEREKLAAAFQLLAHLLFDLRPVMVSVQFGPPLTAAELGSADLPVIQAALLERMRALVRTPPEGPGSPLL